jgi:hypothetical protein
MFSDFGGWSALGSRVPNARGILIGLFENGYLSRFARSIVGCYASDAESA